MQADGKYENFVKSRLAGTFFQSGIFGEFQETLPYRGKSWELMEGVVASCLVIRQKLPLNRCWLWVPYGPLGFREGIFEDLRRIADEENAIFAKIEPPADWDARDTEAVKKSWRIAKTRNRYTPQHTLILDLEKNEEEILAQMKPKGRYNIKIAQKHGVTVKQLYNFAGEDFDKFYELLKRTSLRDSFGVHPKYFYKNLLEIFTKKNMASLFLAYSSDGFLLGGIIAIFYAHTATYYYGASDHERRNLMVPYLLQWEAIREAKKRSMKYYDFLGIAPENTKNHPWAVMPARKWAGITEFKKKFGGRQIEYPDAFDIVYSPVWYAAMRTAKRLLSRDAG